MPSLRPRAILIAGRSSGRPTRVLRTDEVTNSSSSLPTCFERPLMRLPAASAAVNDPFIPGRGMPVIGSRAGAPDGKTDAFVGTGSPGARLYDSGLRNTLN